MVSRKFKLTHFILLTSLTFSFKCLSSDAEINNLENFYVRAGYFGALFNTIGTLEGKEDAHGKIGGDVTDAKGVWSFNEKERIEAGYNPKYTQDLLVMLQQGIHQIRIEFEGLHSQTDLYDENYSNKGKAQYVELRRTEDTSKGTECNSHWGSGKVDILFEEKCTKAEFRAAFKMKNKGFNNLAGMINAYYDFDMEPYKLYAGAGAGLGVTKVKFLGRTRYAPAYQAKLGVSYLLTTQIQAFAGLHYFRILGDQFKDIVPVVKIPAGEKYTPSGGSSKVDETARVESTTATINNRFGIYGLELGLAYHF